MKPKVKGIITPLLIVIGSIIAGVVTGILVGTVDTTGWEALGAIMMVFMVTGLILLVLTIVGLIKYIKNKSDYWLGVLIGIGSLAGLSIILSLFISFYNYIIA